MKKIIASLLFVALAYSSNGKLVGTVVQKSDNAPAVGVNIIIVDTYLGAASDERGKFVILNIPPGSYSVRADAIGFAPVIVKDVRITTAQTTEINISLENLLSKGKRLQCSLKGLWSKRSNSISKSNYSKRDSRYAC